MSELKAVHAFDVYEAYTKTGDDDAAQVYLKSEADKVIAEKDKELRHQKYKRCLAMASKCRLRARWFGDNAFYKKEQWALQWHRRWLELAEKFKEAK